MKRFLGYQKHFRAELRHDALRLTTEGSWSLKTLRTYGNGIAGGLDQDICGRRLCSLIVKKETLVCVCVSLSGSVIANQRGRRRRRS
jgi:hypothetical protein